MPSFVRYNMNGDYTIFTRMKEKGISLAAFATTILFLVLTVVMVSVTLQSAYAWLVMGSTLFLFLTLCSYSSCEKTRGAQWRRASTNSDSVSTISDNVAHQGDCNRSVLPYWITDLPPSYAAATSRPEDSVSPYPPPPAYSTVVELPPPPQQPEVTTAPQPSRDPNSLFLSCGPPERIHSLRIPKSVVRSSPSKNSDALSLDGHLSERERRNSAMDDSSSTC
ncbi:uncharacterized protein [Periplaneta americana]